MRNYFSDESGVYEFKNGAHLIDIWFNDGRGYRYSFKAPGEAHVEEMKRLAKAGKGLTTHINQKVRDNYEKKLTSKQF